MQKTTHTNKHGTYTHETRYLIRRLTEDGLIKPFEEWNEPICEWVYASREEAMEDIIKHELDDALILERVEMQYSY